MSQLRNLNRAYPRGRVLGTPHVGVLGSLIPATGDNGPGYAYNDLSLPADADKEICGRITTWPAAGSLFAHEDTGFTFTGAPDGTYSFQYQLLVDGVAVGSPVTVQLSVGAGVVTVNAAPGAAAADGSQAAISSNVLISALVGSASADGGLATIISLGVATISAQVGAATGQGAMAFVGLGTTVHGETGSATAGGATAGILVNPTEVIMSFTPSAARTVTVNPGAKPFTAGELWNMSEPKKPRSSKDSDSTVDYSFNWTPWLNDVADTIVSRQIIVTEGLQSEGSMVNGALVTVFVSAGTPGKRASITCRITTASTPPRIEDRTIYLDIEAA